MDLNLLHKHVGRNACYIHAFYVSYHYTIVRVVLCIGFASLWYSHIFLFLGPLRPSSIHTRSIVLCFGFRQMSHIIVSAFSCVLSALFGVFLRIIK